MLINAYHQRHSFYFRQLVRKFNTRGKKLQSKPHLSALTIDLRSQLRRLSDTKAAQAASHKSPPSYGELESSSEYKYTRARAATQSLEHKDIEITREKPHAE